MSDLAAAPYNLSADEQIGVRVNALNENGLSLYVPVNRNGARLLVVPGEQDVPSVLGKTDDSITVTWTPATGPATYELYWDAGIITDELQLLVTTEESSFTVGGLQSGRSYSF
jgi:hypothetical protein